MEEPLTRAAEALDADNYQLAAEELEHYIEQYPNSEKALDARYQLANIYYYNLHRPDRALINYRECLLIAPSNSESNTVRERLAEVLADMGRSFEAIAELENINFGEEQEKRRIRLRIAELYYDQKNYSQALTEYAKVTEGSAYDDLSEQAYMREASIHHIARGQYLQAIPVYETLSKETSDPEVHRRALYGLADCYAALFRFDEAIKCLREITDESDAKIVSRRIAEIERQKHEATHIPEMRRPSQEKQSSEGD